MIDRRDYGDGLAERLTLPAVYALSATILAYVVACLADVNLPVNGDVFYDRWRAMQPPNLEPIVTPDEVGMDAEQAMVSGIRFKFNKDAVLALPENLSRINF
ncbi:hypothetical protein COU74_04825 [Candidatus Peregrinibacteria bacterium CG10_big_fil_rev_8_21_14_0_10_36_19]|nr:MAG: hypothetical protein COU74_04825 [Candidatus Peregrinibacteria bacterium CG10_big_fil_rev_8_21_14_0_10_36_19]